MPRPGTQIITGQLLDAVTDVEDRAMPATCRITRPLQGRTYNADDDRFADREADTVYSGDCRLTPVRGDRVHKVIAGEEAKQQSRYILALPLEPDTVVKVGDRVTVVTAHDEQLVGQDLVVDEVVTSSTQTARRYVCTRTSS